MSEVILELDVAPSMHAVTSARVRRQLRSHDEIRRTLNNHIFPVLGEKEFEKMSQADSCIRFIEIRASRTFSLPGGDRDTENGTPMLEGCGRTPSGALDKPLNGPSVPGSTYWFSVCCC